MHFIFLSMSKAEKQSGDLRFRESLEVCVLFSMRSNDNAGEEDAPCSFVCEV